MELQFNPDPAVPSVTPDDGQRNCPKHIEFHSRNKFEKLVHLVGFIIILFFSSSHTVTVALPITFSC
jgi:hypothetical protein